MQMISFIEPATLLKNELFLRYCSRILSEDFFHRTTPCIFVINRSCTRFLDNPELYLNMCFYVFLQTMVIMLNNILSLDK